MPDILKASIKQNLKSKTSNDGKSYKYLDTLWGDIRFKSPKLIVALSVTYARNFSARDNHAIFPAILDTGFNIDFEICESQFFHPSVAQRKNYVSMGVFKSSDGKEFEDMTGNLWLHRVGYDFSKMSKNPQPLLLAQTKRFRVMKKSNDLVWPPLPLLGLGALIGNSLNLTIDADARNFTISSRYP